MQIVGISGRPGAGRRTFAAALARHRGWQFIDLDDLHGEALAETGAVQEHAGVGDGDASVRSAIVRYAQQPGPHRGLVVAPVRSREEAEAICALAGRIVWVEAPAAVRARRLATIGHESGNADPPDAEALRSLADVWCENAGDDLARFERAAPHVLGDDQCCAVEFD